MDRRTTLIAGLTISLLAGCSAMESEKATSLPSPPMPVTPMLSEMIDCLATQESLSLQQRQQQLDTRFSGDAHQPALEQFHHACLLGHTQASNEELRQAQQILNTLAANPEFATTERQALIAIYQRKLELMLALRQQVRETREYRDKIEQLKGLEEELETEAPLPSNLSGVSR